MSKATGFRAYIQEYIPKSFSCWRRNYSKKIFLADMNAGISVGIIALPLAMAFAISSGVSPEKGLFTAIVAGFLISLLGGSRLQIGGPTGAFVIILYSVIQRHGYEGLVLATVAAGALLILMGFSRFGVILKFIPYPVIIGFTTGIAIVILSSQVKDFFGLSVAHLPVSCLGKWQIFFQTWRSYQFTTTCVAVGALTFLIVLRRYAPKLPAALIAIVAATLTVELFHLPTPTIHGQYGPIPHLLPWPSLPSFSFDRLIELGPDILAIALLAGIESLLSATIADMMAGTRHRPNCELVAQGFANIASVIFGGIAATGAIARTTANVQLGAKTPVSGMVHALTILLLMLIMAPFAGKIPLAALAAILIVVAYNMMEIPHLMEIVKGAKDEAFICVLTALLTIFFDLTVSVPSGIILGTLFFIKRLMDATKIEQSQPAASELVDRFEDHEVLVLTVHGPLFFANASHLYDQVISFVKKPYVMIIDFSKVPMIDISGVHLLGQCAARCHDNHILLLISGIKPKLQQQISRYKVLRELDSHQLFLGLEDANEFARHYVKSIKKQDDQLTLFDPAFER